MTLKEVYVGSIGPFIFDDGDTYDDNAESLVGIRSDAQMTVDTAPSESNHVVRLSDVASLVGSMPSVQVSTADNPTELNSQDNSGGSYYLTYEQQSSAADKATIYRWESESLTEDAPFVMDGDGGSWVALCGYATAENFLVADTLYTGGNSAISMDGTKLYYNSNEVFEVSTDATPDLKVQNSLVLDGGALRSGTALVMSVAGNDATFADTVSVTTSASIPLLQNADDEDVLTLNADQTAEFESDLTIGGDALVDKVTAATTLSLGVTADDDTVELTNAQAKINGTAQAVTALKLGDGATQPTGSIQTPAGNSAIELSNSNDRVTITDDIVIEGGNIRDSDGDIVATLETFDSTNSMWFPETIRTKDLVLYGDGTDMALHIPDGAGSTTQAMAFTAGSTYTRINGSLILQSRKIEGPIGDSTTPITLDSGDTASVTFEKDITVTEEIKGSRLAFTFSLLADTSVTTSGVWLKAGEVTTSASVGIPMVRAGTVVGVSVITTTSANSSVAGLAAKVYVAGTLDANLSADLSNANASNQTAEDTIARTSGTTFSAGEDIAVQLDCSSGSINAANTIAVVEVVYDS